MKLIHEAIEHINEELEGAKEYIEKAIDSRAKGNTTRAEKYMEMGKDELKHAGYVRDFYIADIEAVRKVYKLPEEDEEKWEHAHKKILEHMATIKQMLTM